MTGFNYRRNFQLVTVAQLIAQNNTLSEDTDDFIDAAQVVISALNAVDWHEGQRVLVCGRETGTVREVIPRHLVIELDAAPGNLNPFSETVVSPLDPGGDA